MKWLYLVAACLLLQACGGADPVADSAAFPSGSCPIADQRVLLKTFMEQEYYWYAQMGRPDEQAENPDAYFQSLLYKPVDRYSFAEPTIAHSQLFVDGRRVGYGYSLVWSDDARTTLRVRNVEPLSPAGRAGLTRSDTVLSIDGHMPGDIAAGVLPVVNTPGVLRTFRVQKASGELRTIAVRSEDFALNPVAATAVFDAMRTNTPVKVAYLAYHLFAGYSIADLARTFARFREQGAAELILDLRYNGGGSVNVSRDLAALIGGFRTAGRTFAVLQYNDRLPKNRFPIEFGPSEASGFDRVIVIGSGATASASELLINGLRPFVDVVLVGETTYGKPFGFAPRSICDVTYNAVEFETFNALGAGGYTAGFSPDCTVEDDLDRQLGDPQERRIRTALNYIATGSCAQVPMAFGAPRRRAPAAAFGETFPDGMFLEP